MIHICPDEIAAAMMALPFVGYCIHCAKKFINKFRRNKP